MKFQDIDSEEVIDELELKEKLHKKFQAPLIAIAAMAFTKTEVGLTYIEQVWNKGSMLLYNLDKLGYTIIKKQEGIEKKEETGIEKIMELPMSELSMFYGYDPVIAGSTPIKEVLKRFAVMQQYKKE